MNSVKATAHRAGLLYFPFMILGIVREFLFPTFMVSSDPTATARNISAAEPTFRIGILTDVVTLVLFIFLVAVLYELFKGVDRSQALLMVLLVSVGVAVSLANLILQFAPLALLGGADYLSVFTKQQLNALSLLFLRVHSSGATVVTAFWGLWLFPFGILVVKSRYFPQILGYLLMVAGCAYVVFSASSIVLPEYRRVMFRVLMPLFLGEVPIIFWLLIMGAKEPQQGAGPSDAE